MLRGKKKKEKLTAKLKKSSKKSAFDFHLEFWYFWTNQSKGFYIEQLRPQMLQERDPLLPFQPLNLVGYVGS